MPELQANRCCANCKQPYTPAAEEPTYLVSTAADLLCSKCRQAYLNDVLTHALQRSVQKLCLLQERRRKQ